MNASKTAIVIGATGLVGNQLVQLLLSDDRYHLVKIFHRRSIGISHPKLEEHVIDFDDPESWQNSVVGDELFSSLGTTLKTAGSQKAQYKVDYTYQYQVAEAAAKNGVKTYVLISSTGADPTSRIFYSRMKGELDRDVQKLSFERIRIIQPGILDGDRDESRLGETIGKAVMQVLQYIPPLKKHRPIHGKTVAQAMINSANLVSDKGTRIFELEEVFSLADLNSNPT